jgi:deazaflavin-dependent oxidoreductase (nitroreductase family)
MKEVTVMSKTYRVTPFVKLSNRITSTMLRAGLSFNSMNLLTVPGRKSGEPRTVPVSVLKRDGERYLIGAFGEVNWVRNLRAAGRGTLRLGRVVEDFAAVELTPPEAAPILKLGFDLAPGYVRQFFDATPKSSLAEFEREAPRHPVFRLVMNIPRNGNADEATNKALHRR